MYVGDRLYGATYPRRGSWQALDARSGKLLYETTEFLKGCKIYADGRLYLSYLDMIACYDVRADHSPRKS